MNLQIQSTSPSRNELSGLYIVHDMACSTQRLSSSSSTSTSDYESRFGHRVYHPLPRNRPPKKAAVPPLTIYSRSADGSSPQDRKLSDNKTYVIHSRPVNKRRSLTDDGARRVIRERAIWESQLRKNQGSKAKAQKWIHRTPQQMAKFLADGRMDYRYSKYVESAISTLRKLASKPPSSYDFGLVMNPWVGLLSFREMCVVLREQKNYVQARDFFEWMKLQAPYVPSVIPYTILLRIYGQAGRIDLVEDLYAEMLEAFCEPDEVAICSMICVYARVGQIDGMMKFYSMMRGQGLAPPIVVFNSMLSSLYKASLFADAIHLWKDVVDLGVKPNDYTYAMIVNVYRKEHRIEDALHVFEEMTQAGHLPDEILYNIVINMMGKLGRKDDMLEMFERIKAQGLVPSKYTYTYLIHFFSREGNYRLATTLFSEMHSRGFLADEVIYGTIISIYSKLNMYEDAEHALREMESSGFAISGRIFILMANVRMKAGKYAMALELLKEMQSRGLELTKFGWIVVLQCWVKQQKLSHAESAFEAMLDQGFADTAAFTCMLTLYRRLGLFEDGKTLLTKLQKLALKLDEELYGAIINLFCTAGWLKYAECLYIEMHMEGLSSNRAIKTMLMQAYGKAGRLKDAEWLFNSLASVDSAAIMVMLSNYDCLGKKEEAMALSKVLMGCDISVYNNLIMQYARKGTSDKVEYLYYQMMKEGVEPSDETAVSIIAMFSRMKKFQKALDLFEELCRSSNSSLPIHNATIDACIKCDRFMEAHYLFQRMEKFGVGHDKVTISMMVSAYSKAGMHSEAAALVKSSRERISELDTVAYNTFIKSTVDAGDMDGAVELFLEMQSIGLLPSLETYSLMISVFGRAGDIEQAAEMFELLKKSSSTLDEISYSIMIDQYGKAGKQREAVQTFQEMKQEGITPHEVTYHIMMNIYAKSGLTSKVEQLFKEMQQQGLIPQAGTYLPLFLVYGRSGNYEKLERMLQDMYLLGLTPEVKHFHELMVAYGKAKKAKEAYRVFKDIEKAELLPDFLCYKTMLQIFVYNGFFTEGIQFYEETLGSMEPDSFYLSLAVDTYEGSGRYLEARELLKQMRNEGFQYIPRRCNQE